MIKADACGQGSDGGEEAAEHGCDDGEECEEELLEGCGEEEAAEHDSEVEAESNDAAGDDDDDADLNELVQMVADDHNQVKGCTAIVSDMYPQAAGKQVTLLPVDLGSLWSCRVEGVVEVMKCSWKALNATLVPAEKKAKLEDSSEFSMSDLIK